ncbi:MAG: hypothetical protein VR65_19520 [Desulfobulbaceae bacterium BRH_c16a]|nr:MAG: hypothetical protein VR65_19520 [Desulfobulbaceae bacterium BRH_c16a]
MGTKKLKGLEEFLENYPGMSVMPLIDGGLCLRGKFKFRATVPGGDEIEDIYRLEIVIPVSFPNDLPSVKETDGKITDEIANGHLFSDGSLCLGSPLRLLKLINDNPNLNNFVNKCLVPYLYAISNKIRNGGGLLFGELDHGNPGITDDYIRLFGLKDHLRLAQTLQLLGLKKRIANKKPCPCGCGQRLGKCGFKNILNDFRKMAPVSWLKAHTLPFG